MNDRIKKSFCSVTAEEALKEQTATFIAAKIQQKSSKSFPKTRMKFAAVCSFMLVFSLGILGYGAYSNEVSTISIDVNPSIELGLNIFDRVISVDAFNDDAQNIVDSIKIKNMEYSKAIDTLLADEDFNAYLNEESLISITVASEKDKQEEYIQKIQSNPMCRNRAVVCYSGNLQYASQAHELGLSLGKYRAFQELKQLDPDITVDEIRNLSMRQIQNLIESYYTDGSTQPDTENTYPHYGHHGGKNGGCGYGGCQGQWGRQS